MDKERFKSCESAARKAVTDAKGELVITMNIKQAIRALEEVVSTDTLLILRTVRDHSCVRDQVVQCQKRCELQKGASSSF